MSADFYLGIVAGIGLSLIGSWVWARAQFLRHHHSPLPTTTLPAPRRVPTLPHLTSRLDRMAEKYRALDWLTRRRDGESAAMIAWRAGVTDKTVRRATDPYGPFPRPTRHLGRRQLLEQEFTERTHRWVARRRNGELAVNIARSEGVSHQLVSRTTIEHGPFHHKHIDDDTQMEWVKLRKQGWTLHEIAQRAGVAPHRVTTATAGHRPYPILGRRLPPGLIGISEVAKRRGIARNTATKQIAQGLIPKPDFITEAGRRLWLASSITDSEEGVALESPPRATP